MLGVCVKGHCSCTISLQTLSPSQSEVDQPDLPTSLFLLFLNAHRHGSQPFVMSQRATLPRVCQAIDVVPGHALAPPPQGLPCGISFSSKLTSSCKQRANIFPF